MANLRGTRQKKWAAAYAKRPTYQNQIDALARRVSRQRPETQFFRKSDTIPHASGSGLALYTITPTLDQIGAIDFRDNITGDKWRLKGLKMLFDFDVAITDYRILAYYPKKAGNRFNPLGGVSGFTEIPDPTAFDVLVDKMGGRTNSVHKMHDTIFLSLKNRMVQYNSDSTILEKADLCIAVLYVSSSTSGTAVSLSYSLAYSNQ